MNKEKSISISFSGGGWLGICYYIGVLKYLINNYFLDNNLITLGTSAGAWCAVFLLYIKYKIKIKKEDFLIDEFKNKIYKFLDSFGILPYMCSKKTKDFFKEIIPEKDEDFMEFVKDKIHISISKVKIFHLKNEISNPKTYDDLLNALVKSSMIPFLMDTDFYNLDGGFTNNQPIIDEKTIKVNCLFKKGANIYPDKFVNPIYILKIPSLEMREYYVNMGFENCRDYFEAKS